MPNLSKIEMPDGTILDIPGTTDSVVSKTANGLCPQLPNETTTRKYLRQDGQWIQPPNTTTGTTYSAGSVPANTTFGTNGSIKNVYDKVATLGETYKSQSYSGSMVTGANSPNFITLPAGKWLILTDGYMYHSITDQPVPMGLGKNTGYDIRGFQPSLIETITSATNYYIWNIENVSVNTIDLTIKAIRIGV